MNVGRSNLNDIINILLEQRKFGLDTETSGVRWIDRLFNLIISTQDNEYVFTFKQNGTVPEEYLLDAHEVFSLLKPLFNNPEIIWYIQNAKFDMRMLHHEGVNIAGKVICTYALGRVFKNNRLGKEPYSLDAQSRDYLNKQKDKTVEDYIKKNKLKTVIAMPGKSRTFEILHYDKVPFDIMSKYSGTDGRLHYDLGEFLSASIPPEVQQVADNESALVKTVLSMELEGVKLNRIYTGDAMKYEEGLVRESEDSFLALTGHKYDNKKDTLLKVFTAEGAQIPLTEKGNPSLTDDTLEEIDSPAAELVRKIRGHEKRISTYYSSFLFHADGNDIIHADYRQGGTETGRFSCREPNLQNLPAEDDENDRFNPYFVRGCFIPRQGNMFSSVDYKQQEFRMLADYAGETALIKRIMDGADVHQATADLVGITRKQAKTLNFALIYGMGVNKLARSLGIPVSEAKQLRLKYFARFPKIEALLHLVAKRGEQRGYIKTWFGRRQHLFEPKYSYILPNHLIQGGCADVIKVAMNRIYEDKQTREFVKMILTIHDELIFEHGPEHIDLIKPIRKIMESVYPAQNGMILETDHSISHNTLAKLQMEKYHG